jgi:hypothetical protein
MGDWLGLGAPATETEMLRIVEGKLAPAVIKRLISLGLRRSEIDAAIIPLKTLQPRRSRREKLTVEESDRVLRDPGAFAGGICLRKPGAGFSLAAKASCDGSTAAPHFHFSIPTPAAGLSKNCSCRIDEGMFILDDPLEDQPASRP